MKALTVRQPFAECIATGEKTIEALSRPTKHRGLLVIHAAGQPAEVLAVYCERLRFGEVLAVVDLVDCRPLQRGDRLATMAPVDEPFRTEGLFAWVLTNPRRVDPFPARGQLNFWNVADECIVYLHQQPEE